MGASLSFRRLLVPKQRVLTNAKETANRRICILQHEVIITERHALRISVFTSSHDRVSSCQFRHKGLLWILLVACQAFHGRHIPLAQVSNFTARYRPVQRSFRKNALLLRRHSFRSKHFSCSLMQSSISSVHGKRTREPLYL